MAEETLTIKGRTFTVGEHWLYETHATYKRVRIDSVNEYDGTIYIKGVALDGSEESYWRSDFDSRWTKAHYLKRPWAEERQRRSVKAFWEAKRRARQAAEDRKRSAEEDEFRQALEGHKAVKEFQAGAEELASQLERRAAEIRRHAKAATYYWGNGYRGLFTEVAGEIAEEYAGQRTGYGYGFSQLSREAAHADGAARALRKEQDEKRRQRLNPRKEEDAA